ncbi:TetR/AcrR family transcriptional regulator [Bradyrhizobium japonicum]
MTQANAKVTKLNRVERNAWTKQKIFDAATKVVGKHGYAEASVARITEEAGVAQGTFYNHFENRQQLLDQLLPKIGLDMVEFIRARTGTADAARQEIARFSAFFDLSARCRSSCASSTRPNSSRPSATRNISTTSRSPMSASCAARERPARSRITATRNSRPSSTC